MISAIRDITERKRAERVQQDFIAMASHDLLTPVTVCGRGRNCYSDDTSTMRRPWPPSSSRRAEWNA